jgi:hypothetical protein
MLKTSFFNILLEIGIGNFTHGSGNSNFLICFSSGTLVVNGTSGHVACAAHAPRLDCAAAGLLTAGRPDRAVLKMNQERCVRIVIAAWSTPRASILPLPELLSPSYRGAEAGSRDFR